MASSISKTISQSVIFLIVGLTFGVAAPGLFGLPQKWMIIFVAGMIVPFLAFLSGNARQFLMALLVLSLPLRIDMNFISEYVEQAGAKSINLSLSDVLLLMLYILWFVEIFTTKNTGIRLFPRTTIPAIIYWEIALLSLTQVTKMNIAVFELYAMFKAFLMYLYIVNNVKDWNDIKIIAWIFMVTVILESVIGILQYTTGSSLDLKFFGELGAEAGEDDLRRVGGTLGHPNRLAMYLELFLPLSVVLFFWFHDVRARLVSISAFTLGFVAMILTGSRGAWLSFFFSMLMLLYVLVKRNFIHIRRLIKPTVFILLAMSAILFVYWSYLEERLMGDDRGSAVGRIPMYEIAITMIEANPVLGVGLNNYAEVMQDYNQTVSGMQFRMRRPVHNIYLLIAGETGLLGLAAFLWFSLAFFSEAKKAIRARLLPGSLFAAGLLAGLIAFYLHGFVDKHLPGGSMLFYFLVGYLVAISKITTTNASMVDSGGGNGKLTIPQNKSNYLVDQKWQEIN